MPHSDRDIKNLTQRLNRARGRSQKHSPAKAMKSDGAKAYRITIELLVSIGVCGFIGYHADSYFGLTPWGMVIGLLFGVVAGFYTVYKDLMRNP